MPNLSGKVALVTGAARGIGAAIAGRLAQDGAAVAITYSSSAQKAEQLLKAIAAEGGKALAIRADAMDASAIREAVTRTVKEFGGLDILVNNAGILELGKIDEFTDDQFERMIGVNVRAAFYAVREASHHLRDGGRIIFLGSINSDSMPFAGGSVYSLTKAAIAGFVRGLARDLGPRGITVNNIQPGPVETDMNPADGPFAETLKNLMAIKRYAKPREIAALVSYLAGPDASFITGTGIKIDGGFDA